MKMLKTCVSLLFLLVLTAQLLGVTTVLSENFSGLIQSGGSTDISTTLDTKLQTTGWTGSKIYENAGEAKLGSSSAIGYITTKTVDISGASGAASLQIDVRYYGTDSGKYLQVFHAPDGTTFTQVGADISIPSTMTTITVNLTGGTALSKIKISAKIASSNRFYLDNFLLTQSSGPSLATLTTTTVSSITLISASSGGTITSDGGSTITVSGVCWNTGGTPTISDSKTTDGTSSGTYVSAITGLTASTTYHVRAYATNGVGTAYGDELQFITSGTSPPAAPTAAAATSITSTSFVANWGSVTDATSYRLDVSTSNTFSSYVSGYNNLTVTGLYQTVSGLNASTPYYYRVRAYNIYGTSANSGTITATTISDPYSGYYTPVNGLTGDALKTGLHNLIDNNTYSNYDGAKLYMFQTLDKVGSDVRCVYTGKDYTINSSYDGSSDPNTEHTFAQSWFGTSEASIKKADLHHLFVTSMTVNSSRSNYPFDVVANVTTTYPSYNSYISKKGTNAGGHIVFEPADQHKGDLARALLYFSVRYNMSLSIDGVDMLPTLITWNSSDPVDTKESTRNAGIYSFIGNRNPFVDHPEYVSSIWGGSTANTTIQFSPASADLSEAGGSVTLTVSILNPSATAATTAQIQLTDGTAADVNNYTTQTITFPAGSSANQTVTVTVTNDTVMEGDETLVFSLASIAGGTSAAAGNYGSYNLTIVDNDIPTAVAITATSITDTGFTANWNAAAGITAYEFDLSTASDFSSFVNGYQSYVVTGTSQLVTGLNAGTTYYYRVRSFFNETAGANSDVITTLTTGTGTGTVILTEGFEGAATATPPTGWALSASGSYILTNSSNSHGGTNYAGTNTTSGWVETPILVNPTQLTFWGRASSGTANFTITLQSSTDNTNWIPVTTFVANGSDTGTMTLAYTQKTVALNLTGSYYLRWNMTARSGGSFYLDDVEVTSGVVTPTPPAAPVAIAATSITTTGFTANWNASATATSYRLDVSTSNVFATYVSGYEDLTVAGLTQAVTGLTASTTYYYRVRAVNTDGPSANSDVITVLTESNPVVPEAPVVIAATAISSTGFTANWNASIGATSYRLDVSTSDTFGTFVTGYNDLTVAGLTQAVNGLTASTTYYYRVRANNTAGTSVNSDIITTTTTAVAGPDLMISEYLEGSSNNKAIELYNPTASAIDLTQYTVKLASNGANWGISIALTGTLAAGDLHVFSYASANASILALADQTSASLSFNGNDAIGLFKGTTLLDVLGVPNMGTENVPAVGWDVAGTETATANHTLIRKVAISQGNTNWATSAGTDAASSEWIVYPIDTISGLGLHDEPVATISAPVATAATSITTTGFTANWNTVTEATGYRLDVSTSETFTTYVSGYQDLTVAGLTQVVTGLNEGITYYYRVRAVNATLTSINSNTITVVIGTNGDLLISEYVEGSNSYKALEIYNPTAGAINLANYTVNLATNGSAWSGSPITLSGSIAANDVYVIVYTTTNTVLLAAKDLISSSLTFNGNDAVGLFKSGTLLDIVGVPDLGTSVPSVGWPVADTVGTTTANHTLVRKLSITQGNTDWYSSDGSNPTNSEWIVYPIDTFSGLGLHNEPLTPPNAPVAIAATDITTSGFTANWNTVATATSYRLDVSTVNTFASFVTGYNDLTVSGLTQAVTGLAEGTTYYYQVRAVDPNGTSANSSTITVLTDTTPVMPDVPVATDATGISATGFTATWAAAANADSYRLDVSISDVFASFVAGYEDLTVMGLTQAVSGLNAATTYYYRVRAYNTVGTSSSSNVITAVTNSIITTPELFISEYIEGSSNNKAIEIYNPTGTAVDLSLYSVKEAYNGADWTQSFTLSGTLAANEVYVLSHTTANAAILAVADFTNASLNFNGNDAVGLFKNTVLVDVVGIPNLGTGSVPADGWPVAGVTPATKDHTLVRKSETIHGNLDWTASAGTTTENSEWTVYAVDTFTYIGSHTGPSASLDTPVVTITADAENIILTWNSITGALSYQIEACDSPDGQFTDISSLGILDEADGIVTWKLAQLDTLKFFRVIASSVAK